MGVVTTTTGGQQCWRRSSTRACWSAIRTGLSYGVRDEYLDEIGHEFTSLLRGLAVQRGEPIVTLLYPTEAEDLLTRCGLTVVDHLDRDGLGERYLAGRSDVPPPYTTERVLTAAVPR